jgi:hypothetical protein
MGASYGEINGVRSKIGNDISSGFLLNVATIIVNNTSLFNAFVKSYRGNSSLAEEKTNLNEEIKSEVRQFSILRKHIEKNGGKPIFNNSTAKVIFNNLEWWIGYKMADIRKQY